MSQYALKSTVYERELPVSYEQQQWLSGDSECGTGRCHLQSNCDLAEELAARDILNGAFSIDIAIHLKGALDRSALARAMNEIIRRHAVFRTTFHVENGKLFQRIHAAEAVEIPELDLTACPRTLLEAAVSYEIARSMDITLSPPINISLIRSEKDEHVLCISIHHIIFDGWSQGILSREFVMLYDAFCSARVPLLPEPVQYADYMLRPRKALMEPDLSQLLSYWKTKLEGMGPEPLVGFPDAMVPVVPLYSRRYRKEIGPSSLTKQMKALANESRSTIFMVFIAAVATWIFRWTGQTDIGLLIPAINRNNVEAERIIGWFTNQLALRLDVRGILSFSELVENVRFNLIEAIAHSDLPFQKLNEIFPNQQREQWNPKRSTVFVGIDHQSGTSPSIQSGDLNITDFAYTPDNFICDQPAISFNFTERPGDCNVTFGYPPEWFENRKVDNLMNCFLELLKVVLQSPRTRIEDIPL